MAWFPFPLLLAVALGALPTAQAQDCLPLRHEARSESGTLRLQGEPQRWYRGWLTEGGRELQLRDADRLLAAAPSRRARLPLWRQADAEGQLEFHIEAGSGPADSPLHIELHCSPADAALPRALQHITTLAAAHTEHPDPALGWQLSWALFAALYAYPEDADLRLWLLQQQVGLARRAGLMEQAAVSAEQLAALAVDSDRPAELAMATLDRGSSLLLLDGAMAERVLVEAEKLIAQRGWVFPAILARQERCVLARLRGELEAAIRCYRDVVQRFAHAREHRGQINAQYNLTTALFAAGRFAEGREVLAANRTLVMAHGTEFHRGRVATFDSQLATWAGDFDLAFRSLFEAREIFLRLRERRYVAQTDRLIGDRYSLAGEPGRALDYYRRAKRALRDLGLHHVEALVLLSEARAWASIGELDAAQLLASEAEQRLRAAPNRYDWRNAVLSIAEIEVRLGRRAEAIDALASLDAMLSTPQARLRGALLARLDAIGGASERELESWLDEDLDAARLVQALTIAKVLVERQVERGAVGDSFQVVARVERATRHAAASLRSPGVRDALMRQLHELHATRTSTWPEGAVPTADALSLLSDLDALVPVGGVAEVADDAVLALERRIGEDLLGATNSGDSVQRDRALVDLPAAMAKIPVASPRQLANAIPVDETLIYPVMRQDQGGVLIHQDGSWRWQPINLQALRRARAVLHAKLAEGHGDLDAVSAPLLEVDAALGLDRWLVLERPVSLVAHAEFAGLPVEWLLQRRGATGPTTWLHRARQGPPVLARRVALIAASPTASAALPELVATTSELDAVRRSWAELAEPQPGHTRRALVEALQLPGSLVHIAAHGRSARQRHEESGLWLQDGGGQAAFVSALRLRRGAARAALVVLSACETGYSPAQSGLGFGGVASSLVEAGVGAVIAARWPVGDRTARAFAEHFHTALARQPDRPELALQIAQEALRAAPSTRHPTHWAAWFLLRQGLPAKHRGHSGSSAGLHRSAP